MIGLDDIFVCSQNRSSRSLLMLSSVLATLNLFGFWDVKIDFDEHIKQLSGTPILFIPGNRGSYKQVDMCGALLGSLFNW